MYKSIKNEQRIQKLTPPLGKIKAVLDTDAYNEVDDQLAIAYALTSNARLDIQAIYAAPFSSTFFQDLLNTKELDIPMISDLEHGMEMSYQEILKIYDLLDINSKGKVYQGSKQYMVERGIPVVSDAAKDLVKRAKESDELLYVICIGAITNVASAILMAPEIIDRISIVWLAGQPLYWPHTIEFNLCQDILASQTILDSGVPLTLIPCMSVASHLTTTEAELNKYLRGKSKIGTFLAERVINELDPNAAEGWLSLFRQTYINGLDDYSEEIIKNFPVGTSAPSRIVWDISTIGYMNNPLWCPSNLVPTPILTEDMKWKFDSSRHKMRIVNFIYRDTIFDDLFNNLSNVK